MMGSLVAGVIVTHNSAATIEATLTSIKAAGIPQVTVVDNASSDATCTLVQTAHVNLISQAENRGFAQGCNRGAAESVSDFIIFLNPDAELAPQALDKALTHFVDPRVGVVGLGLVTVDGTAEFGRSGREITLGNMLLRRVHRVVSEAQDVAWVSGGAMIVRRAAFQSIGGFDERFFMYFEDVDLCRRLRQQGWRIISEPRARVVHQRGKSSQETARKTKLFDESADRYFLKHYAKPIWWGQHFLRRLYRRWRPQVR